MTKRIIKVRNRVVIVMRNRGHAVHKDKKKEENRKICRNKE